LASESSSRRQNHSKATQIFWILLFLDVCWLFFRYGGLAVADLLVHGGFLLLATFFLCRDRQVQRLPLLMLALFGMALGVGVVQLVPVSPDLMVYLNPVKFRILNEVTTVYPGLETSSTLTMMPELHKFRLTILVMDIYLAILLLLANRPSKRLVTGFLHAIALATALINILVTGERLKDMPLLSRFEGTYGTLVNPNHFAMVSAVFTVFLLAILFVKIRNVLKLMSQPDQKQATYEGFISIAFTVLCLGLTLISFRAVYSRSGLVALLLMLTIMVGFAIWQLFSGVARVWRLGLSMVLVFGLLLFFPLGRGIEKFAEKGLDNLRVTQFKIGVDYLKEGPWLGVGLGSTKSILHPLVPRETVYDLRLSTDFHNEYLQVAVEYGIFGLAAILGILAWVVWKLLPRPHHQSYSGNLLMLAVACMVGGLAWQSLVSFPLRVTAIRVFAMIMVAFGLKLAHQGRSRPCPRLVLAVLALGFSLVLIGLAWRHYPMTKHGDLQPGSQAHKAYRYGSYHQMTKYLANDQLQVVLGYLGDLEGLRQEIAKAKSLYHDYLAKQPFSIQALNGLFMLDIIEYRLDHEGFDEAQFNAWESRAQAISHLGKNRNINARLAKFFLYANHLDYLDQSQLSFYETLKSELAFRYRDARERAESLVPAN